MCRKAAHEALAPRRARALSHGLALFDRMLPKEIIQLPIAEDAAEVCGIPTGQL
ncbi:MAG: hypothetical protein LC798_15335 [Chloroflexi bacterium]|nr:hypothetical protein [Chloroflexota bacterium]